MKKALFCVAAITGLASPAHATGGMVCRTAGPRPIEVAIGFGHVPGAPLILTRLIDNGREVPVSQAQWWLDNSEVRLLLISRDALREELTLRAKRKGYVYEGSVWRGGKRRWVRCQDS
jgi:hypothetical protein